MSPNQQAGFIRRVFSSAETPERREHAQRYTERILRPVLEVGVDNPMSCRAVIDTLAESIKRHPNTARLMAGDKEIVRTFEQSLRSGPSAEPNGRRHTSLDILDVLANVDAGGAINYALNSKPRAKYHLATARGTEELPAGVLAVAAQNPAYFSDSWDKVFGHACNVVTSTTDYVGQRGTALIASLNIVGDFVYLAKPASLASVTGAFPAALERNVVQSHNEAPVDREIARTAIDTLVLLTQAGYNKPRQSIAILTEAVSAFTGTDTPRPDIARQADYAIRKLSPPMGTDPCDSAGDLDHLSAGEHALDQLYLRQLTNSGSDVSLAN